MSLMGSSRFDVPDQQPAGYLLIGDSASIPGMNGIVAIAPDDVPVEIYLEQHDDNDTADSAREASPAAGALGRAARREIIGRGD